MNFLDFEQPIAELEAKIGELRNVDINESAFDVSDEISRLQKRSDALTKSIFSSLTSWQIAKIARHPQRPYMLDYIERIFTDFEELHGDRNFSDDPAVITGIARLDGKPVVVIGQQKGRSTQDRIYRNYGMAKPEGYRKAARIMELAERFRLPIFTFIDTPGAYPGVGAEERGQSEAIATNLRLMSNLKAPIIATVIGEGGSGGALAIGVADCILMLEYSIYSVISPEGCASILWKNTEKAEDASEAMGITSKRLYEVGLIDVVIDEPLGGAHRNYDEIAGSLKQNLLNQISQLAEFTLEDLVVRRQNRLRSYGVFKS